MPLARRALLALPSALAGLPATALARAPGGVLGRILAEGRVRIGVGRDVPLYGFINEAGEPAGMEVDLARDVARSLGVQLELVPLPFAERVAAVALRHVDIAAAALIISPERLRRVAFAHAHGQVTTLLVTTGLRPLASPAELSGRRVLGRSEPLINALPALPSDVIPVAGVDLAEAVAALVTGEAAALVVAAPTFRHLALQFPEAQLYSMLTLSELPYGMAVPLGEPDLLRFLNTWVFLRGEDGTLASLYENYLGGPLPAMQRL